MSIKYINVAFIKNKQKLQQEELKQFTLQKSGLVSFAHEVSKYLPEEEAINESHLCYLDLEEFYDSQYEALKHALSEHFSDFDITQSSKEQVFSIIHELIDSFLTIDDLLLFSLVEEDFFEDYDEYTLTKYDLAALKFIAKIHPQLKFIIEEVQHEKTADTKIIRHYLCNGELVTIYGKTIFPNEPAM